MLFSIKGCLETAGIPYTTAVWQALHRDAEIPIPTKPHDYDPSRIEMITAKIIASTYRDVMLPSITLPSWKPLLGVISSTLIFILVTILLPQWFTKFHVFLDYIQLKYNNESGNEASNVIVKYRDTIRQGMKVLVRSIDSAEEGTDSDESKVTSSTKSLEICPIWTSSDPSATSKQKYSKKKKAEKSTNLQGASNVTGKDALTIDEEFVSRQYGHSYPTYFEWNQCRYYLDTVSGKCVSGGPTFHIAKLDDLYHWSSMMASSFVPSLSTPLSNEEENEQLERQQEILREMALQRYGPYNDQAQHVIQLPTMLQAVYARISSPLVIVQMLGNLLSLVEMGTADTLLSLFQTVSHHYFHARSAIKSAKPAQKSASDTPVPGKASSVTKRYNSSATCNPLVSMRLIPFSIPWPCFGSLSTYS